MTIASYPENAQDRDRWILSHRGQRNAIHPGRPQAFLLEQERAESGEVVSVATIFLANRECPWRCLMCDLWKNTLTDTVATGAIPAQIGYALTNLGPARQIKLYNSGSFFDAGAIPPQDHPAIARQVQGFERVIVECHPALVNERVLRFRDLLDAKLEIAMGLETAHPEVLSRLNKRMTLDQFARAADFLQANGIALRAFVLVKPPFLDETAALEWAKRSIDFALDCGAGVVSLIPTRFGNGALEALASTGDFSPPRLATLEEATSYGVQLGRGRVLADLWDLEKFSTCEVCLPARKNRLERMNTTQQTEPRIECRCGFP